MLPILFHKCSNKRQITIGRPGYVRKQILGPPKRITTIIFNKIGQKLFHASPFLEQLKSAALKPDSLSALNVIWERIAPWLCNAGYLTYLRQVLRLNKTFTNNASKNVLNNYRKCATDASTAPLFLSYYSTFLCPRQTRPRPSHFFH